MNMNRALLSLLVAVAALAFAAPASAAPYTVTKDGNTSITITMDADGGSLLYTACTPFLFSCSSHNYAVEANDGFNTVPAGCTDTDGNAGGIYKLDCSGNANRPRRTIIHGSGQGDFIEANCGFLGSGSALTFNGNAGNDSVNGNCGDVLINLGEGNDSATTGLGTVNGDGGDDTISPDFVFGDTGPGMTINGGDGRDHISGTQLADILNGGPGNDRIEGFPGNDELRGEGGRDVLIPGTGTDAVISGGDEVDTVVYEDVRSDQGVSLSINGAADDGAPDEKDNIGTDVENIQGSPSPSTISGTDGVNLIESDSGNDNVDPGKGNDFVSTGGGDDTVSSRDGALDAVDCGPGNDRVVSDEFDNVTNCETNNKSRELMPDVDNDGVPAPADCDDRDARRRPGLPDKPGNGLDEDCSGRDAPYFRIVTGVQSLFRAGATTKIMRLNLVDVPAGATVEVRCKRGKKTCLKRKKTTLPRGAAELDIRKRFRLTRTKLRPGSILEVRITNTDSIGKVVQYPVRRRKIPISRLRCLPPGAKSPRRC